MQGHTFGDGGHRLFRWGLYKTTNAQPNGYSDMPSSGIYGTNPVFGATADAQIVSDGKNGTPRIADETRPKNIALLYCKKN